MIQHHNSAVVRSGEPAAAPVPQGEAPAQECTKKAFLFYFNWYEDSLISLTEEEQGIFLLIIVRYASQGILPDETVPPTIRSMFGLIRNAIDSGVEKYEKVVEKNRKANARRRRKAPRPASASCVEPQRTTPGGVILDTSHLSLDTSHLSPDTTHLLPEPKEKEEVRPLYSDVEAYWQERGFKSSAREYYDYYEGCGWFSRKGERIRSWKKAAIMWEDKYRRDILPVRRAEQAAERAEQRAQREAETRQQRSAERRQQSAEADRRAAVAVSPDLARRMYATALREADGDESRAMALLRQAEDDRDLFLRLAG